MQRTFSRPTAVQFVLFGPSYGVLVALVSIVSESLTYANHKLFTVFVNFVARGMTNVAFFFTVSTTKTNET